MNPIRVFMAQGTRIPSNDGPGGEPTLTPSEAAMYCQGMPETWYLAAKMKWADDYSGAQKIEYALWDAAVRLKIKEGWAIPEKYTGKEILRKLAGTAMCELVSPGRFNHEESWRLRVALVGVEPGEWKTWSPRYEAVYGELNDWTNEALRHVEKMMAKDEVIDG